MIGIAAFVRCRCTHRLMHSKHIQTLTWRKRERILDVCYFYRCSEPFAYQFKHKHTFYSIGFISLSLSLLNNQTTIMYAHVKPHPINKFLEANKIGIELICFPSHIHTHTHWARYRRLRSQIATRKTDKQYSCIAANKFRASREQVVVHSAEIRQIK